MKISFKIVNYALLLILCVALFYAPPFRAIPHYTWGIAFLSLLISVFHPKCSKKFGIFSFLTLEVIACIFLNIFWSFFVISINNTDDYSYLVFLIGTLLSVLRCFLLVFVVNALSSVKRNAVDVYLEVVCWAGFVCVSFTFLFIFFPGFKTFWLKKVIYSIIRDDFSAYRFRYSIHGFAAFTSSTFSSFTVLAASYLLIRNSMQKKWIKYLFLYLVNILGCFFYGRVCIFAIFLSGLYLLYYSGRRKRILWSIVFILLTLGIGYLLIDYLAAKDKNLLYWKQWAFSVIGSLLKGKGVTDYSYTHMIRDMYFMPKSKTILIGDGLYTVAGGGYYRHTDVGFMRAILFFGFFGMLVNAMMVFLPYQQILKRGKDKQFRLFLHLIMLTWIVLEMKGEAYQMALQFLLPLFYTSYYESKKESLN